MAADGHTRIAMLAIRTLRIAHALQTAPLPDARSACWDARGIAAYAKRYRMRLVGAIATHYHFDHTGGLPVCRRPAARRRRERPAALRTCALARTAGGRRTLGVPREVSGRLRARSAPFRTKSRRRWMPSR